MTLLYAGKPAIIAATVSIIITADVTFAVMRKRLKYYL